MEPARKIRLPLSRTSRGQVTYAKLLRRVDPRSRTAFQWEGQFFAPGTWINESELWPDGTFPRVPLILEHAGAEDPAKGHNSHKSKVTMILWRYDRTVGKFLEVGQVSSPAGTWMQLLEPLVREAMSFGMDPPPGPDLDLIGHRIAQFMTAELDLVMSAADRARVLTNLHDEIAGRIAEWIPSGGFKGGVQPRVV